MTTALEEARAQRIDAQLDAHLNELLGKADLAAPISAHAKIKLRDILKKYAKEKHPFRACVKDNMKRFGPGRVEAVCATLKDTIKGRKDWRHGSAKMSDDLSIDGEVLLALDAISEIDLQQIFLEARALEEHGSVESVALLEDTDGKTELETWGARV